MSSDALMAGFAREALPVVVSRAGAVAGGGGGTTYGPKTPLCDIGSNMLDTMFNGVYNDKQRHETDVELVLQRAQSVGVSKTIVTAGNPEDSARALQLVSSPLGPTYGLFSTSGVHPTCSSVFKTGGSEQDERDNAEIMASIESVIVTGNVAGEAKRVVAIGECGLDYARLGLCEKEQQLKGFSLHLELAERLGLPMFLHNRETEGDFLRIVTENRAKIRGGGVVHSFDGSMEEMLALAELGLYIGINGCSLRTDENLAVAAAVPEHLLLIETDSPWCEIKPTHASFKYLETTFPASKKKEKFQEGCMVKGRNEPCTLVHVLEVLAAIRGVEKITLAEKVWENTHRLFFSD